MCKTCWQEFGGYDHTSPEIERAIPLIHRIWEESEVSIPLHTALDDWNIDANWEPWPDHKNKVSDEQWKTAEELSALMNSLPVEDRCAALARASGYVKNQEVE